MIARAFERLLREQERFEPQIRGRADEGQRVRLCEHDEVIAPVARAEERASVVHEARNPRIIVGTVRMPFLSDLEHERVDLDRVDMRGAVLQRDGRVRAGAGADDEHVAEMATGEPLVELVENGLLLVRIGGPHRLERHPVH